MSRSFRSHLMAGVATLGAATVLLASPLYMIGMVVGPALVGATHLLATRRVGRGRYLPYIPAVVGFLLMLVRPVYVIDPRPPEEFLNLPYGAAAVAVGLWAAALTIEEPYLRRTALTSVTATILGVPFLVALVGSLAPALGGYGSPLFLATILATPFLTGLGAWLPVDLAARRRPIRG